MKYKIDPTKVYEINFKDIIDKLCAEFDWRRNAELVDFLRGLTIDGQNFDFTYDGNAWFKVYVLCPKCKQIKIKLFRVDREYACRNCHNVSNKKPSRRGLIYSRYVRPLKQLVVVEQKLMDDTITLRQRQRYEKKAARLIKLIPEYIQMLKEKILKDNQ